MTTSVSPPRRILKFGGTSVASSDHWAAIAEQPWAATADGSVVVVVSALRGITDLLEAFCEAEDRDAAATGREVAERHRALLADLGLLADTLDNEHADLDDRLARVAAYPDNPAFRADLLGTGETLSGRLGEASLAAKCEPERNKMKIWAASGPGDTLNESAGW